MTAVCILSPFEEEFEDISEYAEANGVFRAFGEAERTRIGLIKDERAAKLSFGGLAALKRLTDKLPDSETALTIARGERGRPYFAQRRDMDMNISHSSELSVAAISSRGGSTIGIDIEEIVPRSNYERISLRFFGAREREFLQKRGYSAENFYTVWTAKEAFAKLTGRGLSESLSDSDTFAEAERGRVAFLRYFVKRGEREYIMTVCRVGGGDIKIICDGDIEINEFQNGI